MGGLVRRSSRASFAAGGVFRLPKKGRGLVIGRLSNPYRASVPARQGAPEHRGSSAMPSRWHPRWTRTDERPGGTCRCSSSWPWKDLPVSPAPRRSRMRESPRRKHGDSGSSRRPSSRPSTGPTAGPASRPSTTLGYPCPPEPGPATASPLGPGDSRTPAHRAAERHPRSPTASTRQPNRRPSQSS